MIDQADCPQGVFQIIEFQWLARGVDTGGIAIGVVDEL